MRSTFRFGLALAALASLSLSLPAFAQERERARVGVGVGLTTFDFNVTTLANGFPAGVPDSIYVPIALSPTFRIEPEFGIATLNQSVGGGGVSSVETSVWSIGLGAFWLFPASPQMDVYVGGRVVRTSYTLKLKSATNTDTTEGSDIRIIPALGGEFSLHPRFSIGAEVQLQLISFGDRTVTGGGSIPGGNGTQTAGLLFVRVYLF